MKRSNILWLALAVVAIGLGARQAYNLVEYPPTKSGLICVGDPKPFDCEFPPVAIATATIGPRPSSTHTSNTSTPTKTPGAPPTATAFPPLLVNGDFEQPNHAGWTVFHLWEHRTEPNDERGHPESRTDGAQSLRFFNENRCWLSGVYQTVSVEQFRTYVFSAHGRTWASYTSVFPSPSETGVTDGVAVGVDPSGGINPNSTAVIWAEADNTEFWRLIEIQFTAFASRVTVFIRARLGAIPPSACQWPLPFMVAFVDGATLTVAGTGLSESMNLGFFYHAPIVLPMVVELTSTPTPATPPTEVTPDPYPVITRVAYP